jgi:hypothetical protein
MDDDSELNDFLDFLGSTGIALPAWLLVGLAAIWFVK